MRVIKITSSTICLGLLAGCNEQPAQPTDQQSPTATTAALAAPQCYAYAGDRDTVRLTLQTTQPTVTGQLAYRYFEKDRTQGTISGVLHGDTLLADYTFQSEGTVSVRQVAFLRRDIGFVEGFGPVAERQGKMMFEQPGTLNFDAKYTLLPIACPR